MKNKKNFSLSDEEICFLDEIIIKGTTEDGVKFRPSDWIDRLCGTLANFDRQKMSYSIYLRPLVFNKMNCLAVKQQLKELNPGVYNFIMNFALENKLMVIKCADFKKQIKQG